MNGRVWDDPGPATVERLTLVSEFQRDGMRLVLHAPVILQAGERYWMEDEAFVVERQSGEIERHPWGWGQR